MFKAYCLRQSQLSKEEEPRMDANCAVLISVHSRLKFMMFEVVRVDNSATDRKVFF